MNIDRIIDLIRTIKEEAPTMSSGTGGFSGSANPQGPVAGFDPTMGKMKKRYASLGLGSRKRWMKRKQSQ